MVKAQYVLGTAISLKCGDNENDGTYIYSVGETLFSSNSFEVFQSKLSKFIKSYNGNY